MKKCYNIKTWEEQKYNLIDLSEKNILIPTCLLTERKLEKMQEWYGKINDMFDLIYAECSMSSDNRLTAKIQQSTPTDPILDKLCELTGAKMYDDYVVLSYSGLFNKNNDFLYGTLILSSNIIAIFNGSPIFSKEKYLGFCCKDNIRLNIPQNSEYMIPQRIFDNSILEEPSNKYEILDTTVFEEYSKHLRNEENKFEEIKQLLNL